LRSAEQEKIPCGEEAERIGPISPAVDDDAPEVESRQAARKLANGGAPAGPPLPK